MTLRVLYQAQNKLTHIFGLIFLCFAYFYDFIIAEPVNIFFGISYFIGQILVNKFLILCKLTVEAVYLICSFLQILYEDSLIFVKDATEKSICIIYLFKHVYLCLEELAWIFVRGLCGIGQGISSFVEILHSTIASVRNGIHFTGSTIWKFLTLIPKYVILKIYDINKLIINSYNDLISFIFVFFNKILEWLGKIYLFFFDIPCDSIYGLIIGAILVTIIYVKFHDICVIISRTAVKFYKQIINFGISLWTGRFLERRIEANHDFEDERLCIVCQYHLKEIIIFPCKHLCLCMDCSLQLVKIRPKCPVCRGNIRKTVKVYL